MQKNTTIIVAIVAAVVVVAAAIGAAVLMNSNSNTPETKDSIVGCYFDYKVVGNYGEDNEQITGSIRLTILSETEEKFEIKTETDVYRTSAIGSKTVIENSVKTEWENKSEYYTPSETVSDTQINTYWGQKDCKKYVETEDGTTITTYQG